MDLAMIKKDFQPFLWGALVGAMLLAWVGFQLVGWKSPSAAERMAKAQAEAAMVAELSSICAVQFNNSPDNHERIEQLKKTERWSRGEVLAKAGFAIMPGDKAPVSGVAEACANRLVPESN